MLIERVLAGNPGPYTGPGTNTWLLDDGFGNVAVIDPGPVDPRHRDEVMAKIADRTAVMVLVTHTHPDHAPLANPLARELGAPAIGYSAGPEFEPDLVVEDRSQLGIGALRLEVIHTPGHSVDHLCFLVDDVLFTGDHIMGGSSVMVEDMGSYLHSLARLRGLGLTRLHPGHGDDMDEPDAVIDWYIAHRRQRHEQIYEAIAGGASTIPEIVETVYADVDRSLHPLAARSVSAHLELLREEGRIALTGNGPTLIPPRPR
jgi:glyoxylase-like metal-dependent hydrolase (beta-lactamase superfamily II)